MLLSVHISFRNSFHTFEVKSLSLSDTISLGMPFKAQKFLKNKYANSFVLVLLPVSLLTRTGKNIAPVRGFRPPYLIRAR